MHRIQYYLLPALLLSALHVLAQTASGHLSDKSTGKAIAYANIGLPYKNIGTTTNEQGSYTLPMPGTNDSDIIKISIIGYQPQIITVKKLMAHPNISLQAKENELREVVIKPKKLKHRILGYTNNNKHIIIGFGHYRPGYELGALLKIKRDPTYIDSVRINVAKCTADTLFFRLNIAEEVNGVFNNILSQPIYITVATKDALNNLVVDLTPYHLVARNNFLVSVELVKDLGVNDMWLCAKLFGQPTYMRTISQAPWTKLTEGGLAISAYVTY